MIDGIACAFAESLHWEDGLPLEGGWDDFFFTRQWDVSVGVRGDHHRRRAASVPSGTGETGNGAGYSAAAIALQKVLGRKIAPVSPPSSGTSSGFTDDS